jgi:hypothetical protein
MRCELLADLADGESRQVAAGTHTVTVTRSGQKLEVRVIKVIKKVEAKDAEPTE